MQDCSNSIANALELLQSCTKQYIYYIYIYIYICVTRPQWDKKAACTTASTQNPEGHILIEWCNILLCMFGWGITIPDQFLADHYIDAIMGAMASQITSLTIAYLTVCSGTHQRKDQNSASLAFGWGIRRWPVNSPHKWPVTRKMFPFDDVIMQWTHWPLGDATWQYIFKYVIFKHYNQWYSEQFL